MLLKYILHVHFSNVTPGKYSSKLFVFPLNLFVNQIMNVQEHEICTQ